MKKIILWDWEWDIIREALLKQYFTLDAWSKEGHLALRCYRALLDAEELPVKNSDTKSAIISSLADLV